MTYPGNRPGWPQQQGGWATGPQQGGQNWQVGHNWPQPGAYQAGFQQGGFQQGGFQQPGGWQQQGSWQQPSGGRPSGGGAQKKILGILVTVCLVGLLAFVVLLFVGGGGGAGYEYEDYEAPPATDQAPDQLTIPASDDEAWQMLRENSVYAGTAPSNVNCEMSPADPASMSDQQLQDHFNLFSACLMRVWDRPMTENGATMFRPTVTVYSGPISTGCGTRDDINAFYCGADQLLYYHADLHTVLPRVGATPLGVESVMAHEFAHFMQGRSGIFGAFARIASPMDERDQYALTRRIETQADCWSAQWIRANVQAMGLTDQDLQALLDIYFMIGDDQLSGDPEVWGNHGLGETRRAWATLGLGTGDMGACNAFTVPDDQVR